MRGIAYGDYHLLSVFVFRRHVCLVGTVPFIALRYGSSVVRYNLSPSVMAIALTALM